MILLSKFFTKTVEIMLRLQRSLGCKQLPDNLFHALKDQKENFIHLIRVRI